MQADFATFSQWLQATTATNEVLVRVVSDGQNTAWPTLAAVALGGVISALTAFWTTRKSTAAARQDRIDDRAHIERESRRERVGEAYAIVREIAQIHNTWAHEITTRMCSFADAVEALSYDKWRMSWIIRVDCPKAVKTLDAMTDAEVAIQISLEKLARLPTSDERRRFLASPEIQSGISELVISANALAVALLKDFHDHEPAFYGRSLATYQRHDEWTRDLLAGKKPDLLWLKDLPQEPPPSSE